MFELIKQPFHFFWFLGGDINLKTPELGLDMKHIHFEHMINCASSRICLVACFMITPNGKNLILYYSIGFQKYFF